MFLWSAEHTWLDCKDFCYTERHKKEATHKFLSTVAPIGINNSVVMLEKKVFCHKICAKS